MLLKDLTGEQVLAAPEFEVEIAGLSADSRTVTDGFVFAALKGARTDGTRFIEAARASGAGAILVGQDTPLAVLGEDAPTCPVIVSDDPRRTLALMAARFYERQPETLVAVTGTSGKTSVAVFVRQIFAHAGFEAASLGTIGTVTSRGALYGSLTTPDPVSLHQTLAQLADDGITHAALEASSHGLDQRRLERGAQLRLVADLAQVDLRAQALDQPFGGFQAGVGHQQGGFKLLVQRVVDLRAGEHRGDAAAGPAQAAPELVEPALAGRWGGGWYGLSRECGGRYGLGHGKRRASGLGGGGWCWGFFSEEREHCSISGIHCIL